MVPVSIVKCSDYDYNRIYDSVSKSLELIGGINRFVKPGNKVLLKMNLLMGKAPEKAITTHPTIVKAVAEIVIKAGGIPSLGDSGPALRNFEKASTIAGFKGIADELGISLLDFKEGIDVDNPQGEKYKKFTIAKDVYKHDVLITLPKIKTHGLTYYTGAMKNIFGCVPGTLKAQYHLKANNNPEDFSALLVDLYALVKPHLSIMDAVVGMDGDGPSNGFPKPVGAIIASEDSVACDAVSTTIVGLEPQKIPMIRIANERRLGIGKINDIEIRGNKLEEFKVAPFKPNVKIIPPFLMRIARNSTVPKPWVIPDKCTACKACVDVCPPKVMLLKNKDNSNKKQAFVSDYNGCIRCFCCHEVCQYGAIELKKGSLLRIMENFIS